jgi:phosphate transport system substrate-binding protein
MHLSLRRSRTHLNLAIISALVAIGLLLIPVATGQAGKARNLSQVKKIYVEALGQGRLGDEFRERVAARLRKDGRLDLVDTPAQADAVMSGTSEIWITGYVSRNPRAPSTTEPVYSGFLSARVTSKDNEVVWSYLVTPRKFAWGGIVHDLADNLAAKLLEAHTENRDVAAAASSPDTATVSMRGAGATFPAPLYQMWFQSFHDQRPNARISYDGVGSEEGIHLLATGKVDFAASDMPISDERMAQLGANFRHFASVLGAVVPIYNLPGIVRPLNFTPETLAEIYLGKIKRWSDPQIRASNRGMSLPDSDIVVVHRSDGSGTTFVWSDFLSKVSPAWKSTVGRGSELKWPVGNGADRNEGVALLVHDTPNSIGYVEMVFALQRQLNFGAVRNPSGQFVRADLSSVTAAAANAVAGMGSDFRVSITNAPGSGAYPVASFTWLIFPRESDPARKAAMAGLLQWILTDGQKECSELGYAPLPREVANRELDALSAGK